MEPMADTAQSARIPVADPQAAQILEDVIKTRRTINAFEPQKVDRDIVIKAIDLARWAPNHHLTEPWHFYLIGDETKAAICDLNADLVRAKKGDGAAQAKRSRWLGMPGWLVVTCERNDDEERYQEDYAAVCAAVQSMTLYLWTHGVGVKWTTGPVTRERAFYEAVWVDSQREAVVGLFWYGYPQEVPHTTRKPVEQIIVDV